MIIKKNNFNEIKNVIRDCDQIALDLETTGLSPYNNAEIFGMAISTKDDNYYFNFNTEADNNQAMILPEYILPKSYIKDLLVGYTGTVFIHNAKFDLAFLDKEGIDILTIKSYCTLVGARVLFNNRDNYSLDSLGSEIGYPKDDTVKKYISKNKIYDWESRPGQKKRTKIPYFNLVPFHIIAPYALQDSLIALTLGKQQIEATTESDKTVIAMENELVKYLIFMEKCGILINKDYVSKAHVKYMSELTKVTREFTDSTGFEDIEKKKNLIRAFTLGGYELPLTEKGNPSLNNEALVNMKGRLPEVVLKFRGLNKKVATYFTNYLYLKDINDVIHTSFNQSRTKTGRFSSSKPNLQNIHKEDTDSEFPVRRSFIPRKDFTFVMFDYDQMEYRLMLDYAGELKLIEQIKNGLDIHTATAELVNITRAQAKTLNFMLLYGGGIQKLALALDIPLAEAKKVKAKYFRKLPNVKKFIKAVIKKAETRGWIKNWYGRKYWFSDDFYKAPNYLIQGGCADIIKLAMIDIGKLLLSHQSQLLLTVHDELICEIHKDEMHLIPKIKEIMENIYPSRHIGLTSGVEWSDVSWHDKKEM